MPKLALFIALGVPGGRYLMPNGTQEYQVLYGDDTWGLTAEEYDAWNAVRQAPCDVMRAPPLVRSLAEDGALYHYDPDTPDLQFMHHHRMAPLGRPIGPLPDSPNQYLILTTNGRQRLTCDTSLARIWLSWWQMLPLSAIGSFSLDSVWQAIPWALRHQLGYLIPWREVK
ncbi:MAG: hypothetical protein ACYCT0_10130 [Sulfobacillus sp.]